MIFAAALELYGIRRCHRMVAFIIVVMLFLTNEPAKKAEINILTARDTTGPRY